MAQQAQDRCETCKYFVQAEKVKTGKCHRNPPKAAFVGVRLIGLKVISVRPVVDPSIDWCGEHKKN